VSKNPRVAFVVAVARNGVIGAHGTLPWRMPSDLKRFKALTMGKPVIMGRKTWESLPRKPLPGRMNIVVTHQQDYAAPGAVVVTTPVDALREAAKLSPEEIAVIGGAEIFSTLLPFADRLYLSEIDLGAEGETLFPKIYDREWRETSRDSFSRQEGDDVAYVFRVLDRIGPARQY
jgi:dihydrofolate reductase